MMNRDKKRLIIIGDEPMTRNVGICRQGLMHEENADLSSALPYADRSLTSLTNSRKMSAQAHYEEELHGRNLSFLFSFICSGSFSVFLY